MEVALRPPGMRRRHIKPLATSSSSDQALASVQHDPKVPALNFGRVYHYILPFIFLSAILLHSDLAAPIRRHQVLQPTSFRNLKSVLFVIAHRACKPTTLTSSAVDSPLGPKLI